MGKKNYHPNEEWNSVEFESEIIQLTKYQELLLMQ